MLQNYINKIELLITEDYVKYFNVNRLYSHQDLTTFVLIGGRGTGKTTGLLIKSLKNFRNNDEQVVYLRRYKSEIKKAKEVFNPIVAGVKTKGIGEGAFEYVINGKRLGYGLALSLQQTFKSGIDFTKVTTLIYDEAILQRGGTYRYLSNEIEFLLELISTIFRTRKNYKVFIIGNNADVFNPYFEYWNVPTFKGSWFDRVRGLYCELIPTKAELLEVEKETPLYRLTKGTNYGNYHYDNEVLATSKGKIAPKDYRAVLMFRLVFNKQTLNIYRQRGNTLYVEWKDKVINDSISFIILENNSQNYYYIKTFMQSDLCTLVRIWYYDNRVIYHNAKAIEIFSTFMEMIK